MVSGRSIFLSLCRCTFFKQVSREFSSKLCSLCYVVTTRTYKIPFLIHTYLCVYGTRETRLIEHNFSISDSENEECCVDLDSLFPETKNMSKMLCFCNLLEQKSSFLFLHRDFFGVRSISKLTNSTQL